MVCGSGLHAHYHLASATTGKSLFDDPGDRRYRYYVCRVAHEKGWQACATKSIAARVIEESVVTQLRSALRVDGTRDELQVSDADRLAFDEGDPGALVRAVVQRITYDGTNGAVSLELSHK